MNTEGSVEQQQRTLAKTRRIIMIDHPGAGKHAAHFIRVQRVFLLPPMDKVITGGVSPPHWPPGRGLCVVLKEQVPGAFVEDQAIGVVEPVLTSREVKLWPVQFLVNIHVQASVTTIDEDRLH